MYLLNANTQFADELCLLNHKITPVISMLYICGRFTLEHILEYCNKKDLDRSEYARSPIYDTT